MSMRFGNLCAVIVDNADGCITTGFHQAVSNSLLMSFIVANSVSHVVESVALGITTSCQFTVVPSVVSTLPAFPACGGSAPVIATVKSMYDSFAVLYPIDVIAQPRVITCALMLPLLYVSTE
jgi:hypothetical protein